MPFPFRSPKTTPDDPAFIRIGLDPDSDEESRYTVELLMSHVGLDLYGDAYWKKSSADGDARRKPGYRARVDRSKVREAWRHLQRKPWIGLQCLGERPIRSLAPLEGFAWVEGMSAGQNRISDLTPLRGLSNLRTLYLSKNRIADLSPLENLPLLEHLEITDNPLADIAALSTIPNLRELAICSHGSTGSLFHGRECWLELRYLTLDGEEELTFSQLPSMPKLLSVRGPVSAFDGIARSNQIRDLHVECNRAPDLIPLGALRALTHLRVESTVGTIDLSPLRGIPSLRSFAARSERIVGADALSDLPALRSAHLVLPGMQWKEGRVALDNSGWDAEFQADRPAASPSAELEVVSDEEFSKYDTKVPYGLEDWDGNRAMLESELSWILGQIEESLRLDWTEEEIVVPWQASGARSHTVCLFSPEAAERMRTIITRIQTCLCRSRRSWIIYFQSDFADRPNFTVWLYPDRIQATPENKAIIERWLQF